MVKVAINGFGRIGRNALKILLERHDAQVVAINDITDAKTLAHLLKHDSSYGTYDKKVIAKENAIVVNTREIPVFAEKDPAKLPWGELGVDVVIESTGFFTKPEDARAHIKAGAKKVVISAPAKGEGAKTVVLGVNEDVVEDGDVIISNASCTTNCIAPVMKVLEDEIGIEIRHRLGKGMNRPAVLKVAHHIDGETVQSPLRLLYAEHVQKRLGRMLVGTVTGIDHRHRRDAGGYRGGAFRRMAHHYHIHISGHYPDGVFQRLPFRHAGVSRVGEADDPCAEPVHGSLERKPGSGGRLEEKTGYHLAGEEVLLPVGFEFLCDFQYMQDLIF